MAPMGLISDKNLSNVRKLIKNKILNNDEFVGHQRERQEVHDLLKKTIEQGESNSALLIGPKNSGKSTMVKAILSDLKPMFTSDALLVQLHGLIHTDDRSALKAITSQMNLDNAVDGKVFGSFADNLAFLLACLKSGRCDVSKSVIFILEEFDLFCAHHKQTLLYNLFDVSQSAQTPICVLGITCRFDVIELLEKRVKSRFSHRQIFLFLGKEEDSNLSNLNCRLQRLEQFLLIPNHITEITTAFKKTWNSHVKSLLNANVFKKLMQHLLDLDLSEKTLRNILLMVISQIDEDNDKLTSAAFEEQIKLLEQDEVVQVLQDLSVLELCLIIAMKHHCEIYDNQPMNFEMVLSRYTKFANVNSSVQSVQRNVIMKAFEHIQHLELISLIPTGSSAVQNEYKMFQFLVEPNQVSQAVKKSHGLPTEIIQWANSSLV